jgi:serine/threonine protein kinase
MYSDATMTRPFKMNQRGKMTRRNHGNRTQNGGTPIFAGAQGCVFRPALKCNDRPRNDNDGAVSKLEERINAEAEMREYEQIKQHLMQINNYKKYFSVQASLCEPDALEPRDLHRFDDVCINFKMQGLNISAANINDNLSKLRMINMPDLGIDLTQWMNQTALDANRIRKLNEHVSNLLVHAVGPMNRLGVIHNDLKSENIMMDWNNDSRIIDWGLAGISTATQVIPARHFMRNPVTFNRPFSTMVISPEVMELYSSSVLKPMTHTRDLTVGDIKPFTRLIYKTYISDYDDSSYKYLQYIFKSMFGGDDAMLMDAVATYTAEVLHHFTDHDTRTFRLNEYFSNVYRHNTDVWGLMSVFYTIFMLPRNRFVMSYAAHADMLNRYRTLFRTVVFANGHKRMNVAHIVQTLRQIGADAKIRSQKRTVRFNLTPARTRNSIKRVPTPYPHPLRTRTRIKIY